MCDDHGPFESQNAPFIILEMKQIYKPFVLRLRYYKGRVESVDASTYYYVVFEDGSFCHDLPPEDIVVSDMFFFSYAVNTFTTKVDL